jgi:hypothetical protein
MLDPDPATATPGDAALYAMVSAAIDSNLTAEVAVEVIEQELESE